MYMCVWFIVFEALQPVIGVSPDWLWVVLSLVVSAEKTWSVVGATAPGALAAAASAVRGSDQKPAAFWFACTPGYFASTYVAAFGKLVAGAPVVFVPETWEAPLIVPEVMAFPVIVAGEENERLPFPKT